MSELDVIEAVEEASEEDSPEATAAHIPSNSILIKGAGSVTVFGVSNRWDSSFPRELTGKVAPEEFSATMARLNGLLRKSMPVNVRWLFCGCLLCCCTLGCSLWPVLCLSRRTIRSLHKALDWENHQLYHRLRLHWRLARVSCDSSNLAEYVLILQPLPKPPLLRPD